MFSRIYVFSFLHLFALAQPPPGPPDYSRDRIAPYPPLTDPTTENTLGTRLFGWQGCGGEGSAESQYIKDAYDDMNRIASLAETSSNIDWKGQAAKDFWGPSAGPNVVRDGTRVEITRILKNVQQLYSTWWGVRPSHWIRVRCSGGDGTGDPTNHCGDAPIEDPNAPRCPDGTSPTVPPGEDASIRLEAYSDPLGNAEEGERADYSQITFCNGFFSKLTLAQAITAASRDQDPNERMNLQNYDNQARIFFHEATHLDWFMESKKDNPDGVPPWVTDLLIQHSRPTVTADAYGVFNCKIVGNYRDRAASGYYAQRNADSFAWFSMANYVKSQIGQYPIYPMTNKRFTSVPRDVHGEPVILEYTADIDGSPNFDLAQLAAYSAQSPTFRLPQCGDKSSSNSIGDSSRNFTLNAYDSDVDYEPEQLAQRHAWLANGYKMKISNTKLKILPLGDSITYGFQSTDGNGYRGQLFTQLSGNGNTIDLVGSVRSGSMVDNSNEGHNGATIDQIASYASASLPSRPNVVLVHVGTNDMNLSLDPAGAPSRLGNLIDKILVTCPDALVLVSQIISSGSAATRANVLAYNEAIPGVVAARAAKGSKVMVVDMFTRLLAPDNYADDLHPNNSGYKIMGDTWSYAIAYANALGWISPPATGSGLITCAKLPTWYPQGQIANGAGLGANAWPSIKCVDDKTNLKACACAPIDGIIKFIDKTGDSCQDMGYNLVHAVHFADLNGDGRAEYLWVDAKGAVTAFLNLGPPNGIGSTTGATVNWLPQGVIATGVGAARHEVQFADLNGDGRAEYLRVHSNGSVEAWLNLGGPDDGPNAAKVNWLYNGIVASGTGAPGSSVMFADLNGDGRAEYLSIAANGAVTCWLNLGPIGDNGPNAAKVGWLPQGVIATGVGALRNNTVFADINGDGKADYLTINRSGSGSVKEWLNSGGPNNGPNAGQPVWYPQGTITTGDGSSGANVVFADLNGDGRAEYIIVDPNTSAITAYMNACP